MKKWLKEHWDEYWRDTRLANTTLLFSSSLTVVEFLIWRLDLPLPISKGFFYGPTAIGALVGYYLPRASTSKLVLLLAAIASVTALTAYRYDVWTFNEITFDKVLLLVLLLFVAVGALFAGLRVLLNMGLE